jgi:hypothetical protein
MATRIHHDLGGWFPQLVDTTLRQVSRPPIAAHHDLIRSLLGAVTVSTVPRSRPNVAASSRR